MATKKSAASVKSTAKPGRKSPARKKANPEPETAVGVELIEAIKNEQLRRGLTQYEVARELKMQTGYLSTLLKPDRGWRHVSPETLHNVAKFLNVSRASVFMMAEILKPEDFVNPNEVDKVLDHLGDTIMADPRMPGLVPSKVAWQGLERRWQVVIGLLYQELTGRQLLAIEESGLTGS